MGNLTSNQLEAFIEELKGPLDSIDWDAQKSAWAATRLAVHEVADKVSNALIDEKPVEALEQLAALPIVLDFVEFGPAIDSAFGEGVPKPFSLSALSASRLKGLRLESTGPVLTAYRHAVRSQDVALIDKCKKVTALFDSEGRLLERPESIYIKSWAAALVDAKARCDRESAEAESAQRLQKLQTRKKIFLSTAIAFVFAIGTYALYLSNEAVFNTALDAYEEALLDGGETIIFSSPSTLLPLSMYPAQTSRLEQLDARLKDMRLALRQADERVADFEDLLARSAPGDLEIETLASTLQEQLDGLPRAPKRALLDRVANAADKYRSELEAVRMEQESAFRSIFDAYLPLEARLRSAFTLESLDAWHFGAVETLRRYQTWSVHSLPGLSIDPSLRERLESLEDRVAVVASLLTEARDATAVLESPDSVKTVRPALERLAGLKSSGIVLDISERAAASLPFWRSSALDQIWRAPDAQSAAWIERGSELSEADFSVDPTVAPRITELFRNPAFVDVWQYFRYNYAGTETSVLVYTEGPVENEETLIDDLREIYLVNQKLVLLDAAGRSEIASTANRDGLGRYRGIVYDDGILTLESRVAQQLADLWDPEAGLFTASPLPLLETILYDERLAVAFRMFLLQWIEDVFEGSQDFFEFSWHSDLVQASNLMQQANMRVDQFTWFTDSENQRAFNAVLGRQTDVDWTTHQRVMIAFLSQLKGFERVFEGWASTSSWQQVPTQKRSESKRYVVWLPEASAWIDFDGTLQATADLWLPVWSIERIDFQKLEVEGISYPEPAQYWQQLMVSLPVGLQEML